MEEKLKEIPELKNSRNKGGYKNELYSALENELNVAVSNAGLVTKTTDDNIMMHVLFIK